SSTSGDDTALEEAGYANEPLHLSLTTCDMQPIPLSTPVGMLKSLTRPSDLGPLVLSASFSPFPSPAAPTPTPSWDGVLADTQYPTLSSTAIAHLPGMEIDTDTAIICGIPFIGGPDTASASAPSGCDDTHC
ncbi:hypothetical protein KIPB_016371, partial [Kipferlia bialata]